MAEPQVHTIFRQILEIEMSTINRAKPTALADVWSDLAGAQLPALLERAFDAAVPADQLLQIDQLEILLEAEPGESPEAVLARELPRQLARALAAIPKTDRQQPTLAQRVGDWAIFYLENGYLPWSAPTALTQSELEYRLTESLVRSPALVQQLRELLLCNQAALYRLLLQFSPIMSWRILLALYPTADRNWSVPDRQRWLEQAAPALRVARWQQLLREPVSIPKVIARITQPIRVSGEEAVAEAPDTGKQESVFITNAGLILLHPFLERLFRTVGYTDGHRLTEPNRAVHLLHYLAAGTPLEAEWQLVLPKVLCGLPLKRAVDPAQLPNEEAKAGADEMLRAAIDHWAALKNTSIEGLRTSFLQREGRLILYEEYWSLRVERRPYDLLLDHLPWGIGTFRLPWMANRMAVEWGT